MKSTLTFVTSALALAALLAGTASQATNLAELPLNTSVLAKPNVIIGMDDSGSMDSEVLLNTADGVFWWNFDTGRGWDGSGVFYRHVNLGEYWSSTWRRYFYLFPNGQGGGLNIKPENTFGDWSLMPTTEMAWARAADYNPQYYNPSVTYLPWSAADTYAAFADATPGAARGHPITTSTYGGAANTVNLTATLAANNNPSRYFTAVNGMKVPGGASRSECDSNIGGCSGWTTVASDAPAQAGKVTRVAMAYWPATYWIKATASFNCTVPTTPSVATDNCALAPDGVKLRRIEIRSTNTSYPSGRGYAAELQNFANWFQYHRKRRLSANGSMGAVLEDLTGLNMGLVRMNALPATGTRVSMKDLDSTVAANNGKALLKVLYEIDSDVGTPTRAMLDRIGYEFKHAAGPITYACQRNAALVVTDGYAASGTVSPPSYASTWGIGAPYQTTYGGTLADIALSYYTNTMGASSFATGKVPASTTDTNTNLHMNTYALTLGAKGDVFMGESTPNPTATSTWVNPNTDFNPSAVDDLWHATINGRGKMYLATAASDTAAKLQAAFNDILSQDGAQGGVAVSTVNLDRGDGKAYLGSYNQRGWVGDLERRSVSASTGVIQAAPEWLASSLLAARSWSGRIIFSASGSSGTDFTTATFGATANPDTSAYSNQQVVEYLRGNRSNEGSLLRTRSALLGPVVNGEPVLARDEAAVYVASGEGMLHAFDTATGTEQWAFVPPDAVVDAGKSVERTWTYRTLLDATPAYGRLANGRKLLVGGMGAAGRTYYALDVTTPLNLSATAAAAQFKWIFPASSDATNRGRVGFTLGKPALARTAADGDVVLVTSGYDNGQTISDGKGRLWVLNASTGAVIKSFRTTAGTAGGAEAGLAHVSPLRESDGTVRYVYGGDLLGNVWQFDLAATAGTDLAPTLVATLKDASGTLQPVTAAPELVKIGGKRVILVGSGRVLDLSDFGSAGTQTFYAIADGATLSNARSGLVQRTYTRGGSPELSTGTFNWASDRGWYIDLPAGEQANTPPSIAYGAVVFVGNKNGSSDCSQQSWLYLVDIGSGSTVTGASAASFLLSSTATSSRAVVLRDASGGLHATTQLSSREIKRQPLPPGDPIRPSKNAWKEIRR